MRRSATATQEQPRARDLSELRPKPFDDDVGGDLAVEERLKRDEDEARIGLSAAGEADDTVDRRIGLHDLLQLRELLLHRLKRNALIALDVADQQAGVLRGEQAVGDLR